MKTNAMLDVLQIEVDQADRGHRDALQRCMESRCSEDEVKQLDQRLRRARARLQSEKERLGVAPARRSLTAIHREVRTRLLAGEDLSSENFAAVRSHDGLELDLRVSVQGKKFILTDAAKDWSVTSPIVTAKRSAAATTRATDVREVERTLVRAGVPACAWRARSPRPN